MSLEFADASSNLVDWGNGSGSLTNLTTGSLAFWMYPLSTANALRAIAANSGGTRIITAFQRAGDGTQVRFQYGASTAAAQVDTDSGALVANQWVALCFTWNDVTNAPKAFRKRLTAAAVDVSTSGAAGSGTHDDTSGTWRIGSRVGSDSANMRVGPVALFNRQLSLAEFESWANQPRMMSGCLRYFRMGWNGTGAQPDWSGNGGAGSVTGATVAADVPLMAPFGYASDWMGAYRQPSSSVFSRYYYEMAS